MPSTATSRLEGLTTSVAVKAPCRVATTANLSALSGLLTIDGVTVAAGDRVLVKDQTTGSQNGIYVAASGAWERALDFNGSRDAVGGTQMLVISGTANANSQWRVAGSSTPVIGTDSITFSEIRGDTLSALTRAELAAFSGMSAGQSAILSESGREGVFVWSTANLQTQVTNDPSQGVYIPPTGQNGSTGAWVRKYDGPLNVKWFGTKGDTSAAGVGGTDDTAAIQAAIEFCVTRGGGEIYFPTGNYKCASSLNLDGHWNITFRGPAGQGAGYNAPPPTQLIFTGTGTGRFISAQNGMAIALYDLGVRYTSASYTGDLVSFTNTNAGSDAAYCIAERCLIAGISVATARSLVSLEGAILCSLIDNHIAWGTVGVRGAKEIAVGNVLYSNAHVIQRNTFDNLTTSAILNPAQGWNIDGNWFEGTNGGSGGMPCGLKTDISGASVASASGLKITGNWFGDMVNGAAVAWIDATNLGMRGADISGNFIDTGSSTLPGIKLGGTCQGVVISGNTFSSLINLASIAHYGLTITGNFYFSDPSNIHNDCADLNIVANKRDGAFAKTYIRQTTVEDFNIGGSGATGPGLFVYTAPSATDLQFRFNTTVGRSRYIQFRTDNTSRFNVGMADENTFWIANYNDAGGLIWAALAIDRASMDATFGGNVDLLSGKAYKVNGTTVIDSSRNGSFVALSCTSNATLGDAVGDAHVVNGTLAGTNAITSSHATAGIGYATGAGGAVTQITSRTTGVTINKASGAITLVSAAGQAGWQSFTVTNSAVAATDVIKVCQKSGTDKNMIHVTNVAAGSFEITFATTGGTTAEQPVFNFAVLKAVAA